MPVQLFSQLVTPDEDHQELYLNGFRRVVNPSKQLGENRVVTGQNPSANVVAAGRSTSAPVVVSGQKPTAVASVSRKTETKVVVGERKGKTVVKDGC